MPVSDASYMLRLASVGNLDANEQSDTGVNVGAGPIHGMKVRVYCPQAAGTSPTLDIKIQEASSSGGSFSDVGTVPQISAAGTYEIHIHWTKGWLRQYATVGGTGPNFGAVTIGLTPGEIPTT